MCKTLDPDLTAVLDDAAGEIAFHIVQTLRTQAEQTANLAKGVSQTKDSLHLPDSRGLARAADLAALNAQGKIATVKRNGKDVWGPDELYYAIAEVIRKRAVARSVNVRWGGCWRLLNTIPEGTTCAQAVADYAQERRMLKQTPFFDFGHFEKR
jgi:peptidoglycan L-alanyl-D-glutamate endopeptidase CwlK